MITRRRFIQSGLVAAGSLALTPLPSRAQSTGLTKVRYSEVIRSMFYAPTYAAISRGLFRDAGLDVEMSTANGGDKGMAALLGGSADIALMGPEVPIFVFNSESPLKARMFCGMTATDGFLLVARQKSDAFDWSGLRGKEILGWRPASTPQIFLESAMRMRGLDPQKDTKMSTNIAPPARLGAWLSGQTQYAIFPEPDAAQLELDGKGHVVASIGQTVGMVDYTVFMATDRFLDEKPAVVQAWTNAIVKAMKWTQSASTAELSAAVSPFFPGVGAEAMAAGIERYRRLQIWKTTPHIAPSAVERFQDILVENRALEAGKRVKFTNVVVTGFADKAA